MLYWICLALVVLPLVLERILLGRWREKIPLRVHVHGTRGKSSTVRDCARLLREHGLTVLAKTTGDAPEYILPDGRVQAVRRFGPARIQEHLALLRKAAGLGADVVVAEGMALAPENVWQSEQILAATHAVITNTRPDHAECMGSGRRGVVRTLGLMIPENRKLFTAAEDGAGQLVELAAGKHCAVSVVDSETSWRQPGCLAHAVAGAVLGDGVVLAPSDPIAATGPRWADMLFGSTRVRFLDLFSTNDVETAALLWKAQPPQADWLCVALLATRSDRPLRTRDFLEWLVADKRFDVLLPQGSHAGCVWLRAAWCRKLMVLNPWMAPARVVETLAVAATTRGRQGVAVVGLGNCHGVGERWRNTLAKRIDHAC